MGLTDGNGSSWSTAQCTTGNNLNHIHISHMNIIQCVHSHISVGHVDNGTGNGIDDCDEVVGDWRKALWHLFIRKIKNVQRALIILHQIVHSNTFTVHSILIVLSSTLAESTFNILGAMSTYSKFIFARFYTTALCSHSNEKQRVSLCSPVLPALSIAAIETL